MMLEDVKKVLSTIKKGTFTRIHYVTELPLKAEFKHQGYKIYKDCSMTTRFGIHYGNIKEVKERDTSTVSQRKRNENTSWEDKDNKILYNSEKGTYYLCSFPTKMNRHSVCKYIIEHNGDKEMTDLNNCADMVINSYWNKKATNMVMMNIDNIISIGS